MYWYYTIEIESTLTDMYMDVESMEEDGWNLIEYYDEGNGILSLIFSQIIIE